jgi:protein-S-isoprenylcysteine O-methyltransferase Ste14
VYIGTSIFLIAVGAILRYAVTADAEGINLDTAGLILMIVGAVGLLFSLLWMTIWADRRRGTADRAVVTDPARERVVERDVY